MTRSADLINQAGTAARAGEDESALGLLASVAAADAPTRLPELAERLLIELAESEPISLTVRAQAWRVYAQSRRSKGADREAKRVLARAYELAPDPDLLIDLATLTDQIEGKDAVEGLVREGLDRWPDALELQAITDSLAGTADSSRVRAALEDALRRQPNHPDMLMRLARLELEEGRPEQAVEPARRLVVSNPAIGRALLLVALYEAGRLAEDPGLLDAVATSWPDDLRRDDMGSGVDATLLTGVARALLDADRPDEARALLDRAQALGSDDVEIYRTRGFANAALGDYTAANTDLEQAARVGTDPWLTALRAEVLRVSGHPDDALALFAELDPADGPRWVAASRAAALVALGDVDGARSVYEEALRRDPRDVNALCGLGEIELDHGGEQGLVTAEDRLRRAVALAPSSARAHAMLGEILRRRGQFAAAVDAFDRALSFSPTYSYARATKGEALIALGRREDGIALLAEAAGEAPETPWILDTLVDVLSSGEEYAAADRVLRGVQRSVTRDGQVRHLPVLVHRAELAKRNGDPQAAERFYRKARELDPVDGELGRKHVSVLLDVGRADEALAILDSLPVAAEPDPEREWARIRALWALERLPEVRTELERLVAEEQAPARAVGALGEIYRLDGNRAEARRLLSRALDGQVENRGYVLASLGALEFDDGDLVEARRYLREALSLNPTYPFPFSVLISLELANGEATEVIDLLGVLGRSGLPDRERAVLQATGLYGLGEYTAALEVLEAFLLEHGDDASALRLRGWLHVALGVISRAASTFRAAAEIPDVPAALVDNCFALCWVGNWTEALRLATRARETGNPFADVALAGVWISAGDYGVAQEFAHIGRQRTPQSRLGAVYAARALRLGGDAAGAVEIAASAHDRWPHDVWITKELGECLAEAGNAEAGGVFEALLAQLRRRVHWDADDLRLQGRCLLRLDQPQEATHILLRALSASDPNADVLLDLLNVSLLDNDIRQVAILEHRAVEEVSRLPAPIGRGVVAAAGHDLSSLLPTLGPEAEREAARIVGRLRRIEADLELEVARLAGTVTSPENTSDVSAP